MKKLDALYFIESPLQLLNAYEASCFFCCESNLYIIRLSGKMKNDNQMISLCSFLRLKRESVIFIKARSDSLPSVAIGFFRTLFYLLTNRASRYFVGNIDSRFIKLFYPFIRKNIVLLDDGLKSVIVQSGFNKENYLDMFSMYELPSIEGQNIYRNDYTVIRDLIGNKNIKKNNSVVFFIGTKISECGLIDEEAYLITINKIIDRYIEQGLEFVYIPHRDECYSKLKIISSRFGVRVEELSYPVELIGFYEREIPCMISSFYSTALYTMRLIYNVDVDCFKFHYGNLDEKTKGELDSVYCFYSGLFPVKKI